MNMLHGLNKPSALIPSEQHLNLKANFTRCFRVANIHLGVGKMSLNVKFLDKGNMRNPVGLNVNLTFKWKDKLKMSDRFVRENLICQRNFCTL